MTEEQKQIRRDYARANPRGFVVYKDPEKVKAATQRRVARHIQETPFEQLGWDTQRKVVLKEQKDCCGKCGISDWLGKPITLDVDHIDGDNTNNIRSNLIALCPNCHSQTDTFRGKNKKRVVSDEEIIAAFDTNIRQTLLKVGLTPKGANYKRVKRIMDP